MQYSTVQYSAVQYSTVQYSRTPLIIQQRTVQHSIAKHSKEQHVNTVHHSAQHSTVQYRLDWVHYMYKIVLRIIKCAASQGPFNRAAGFSDTWKRHEIYIRNSAVIGHQRDKYHGVSALQTDIEFIRILVCFGVSKLSVLERCLYYNDVCIHIHTHMTLFYLEFTG